MGASMSGVVPPLPRTTAVIRQGIADKLHLGVQLYVSIGGAPVADVCVGEIRPGIPLSSDTLMLWLSSCKPVGAVAIAQLWERGTLDLDDRVSRFIPEFGVHGKDPVTIRHLLTHTGGFRFAGRYDRDATWEEIIASICDAALERGWIPGARAGYHPSSSWYILAEIVRRVDGRVYSRFVREAIFEPLGLFDSWIEIPEDRRRGYGDRIGVLYSRDGVPHSAEENGEAVGRTYNPGGSGRGPVRELGRFYEMLLARGGSGNARILSPQATEALTARHRTGMLDETFQHRMDWGLGFILDSKMHNGAAPPYGYGPYASPRTFGHSGSQSSCAFCDPERGLIVAWAANGMPGEPRHQARARLLNAAIYEDVGLARTDGA
jgi:CubicO group peptidase (beta-lactamase class C family)